MKRTARLAPLILLIALAALASVLIGIALPAGGEDLALASFADVEPLPAEIRSDGVAIEAEIARRTAEWENQFGADEMSEKDLSDGILILWSAMAQVGGGQSDARWEDIPAEDSWLAFKELGERLQILCQQLPEGHELRKDFC